MYEYGVQILPHGEAQMFHGDDAAGKARAEYAVARQCLLTGESVAIFSLTPTGKRQTMETARAN